ncbi:hypothetical protein [Kordia jejudonensis]|uniref:hypothetical protein n=1 Tax=Kordia jejudonensis TaxID=1348245 RepID=UPI0012E08144|nr:hypothetical protein [Kordia jejudonensis]
MKIHFITFFIAIIIMSCKKNENRQAESLEDQKEMYYNQDSLYRDLSIIIDLQDTLVLNKKYRGEVKFLHLLQDSIRLSNKDERFNIIYLNIFDHKKEIYEIKKKESDTFYGVINNLKDTLITTFYITPKKLGTQHIGFTVDEKTYLEAYKYNDSTETRALFNTFTMSKSIYVKEDDSDENMD